MKTAIISSAQVGKYGRMDAGFHIAVQEVAEQAAKLEQTSNADMLLGRLAALETEDLRPLAPLVRGSQDHRREALLRAAAEYPYIAYALVARHVDEALARAESALQARKSYLQTVQALKNP